LPVAEARVALSLPGVSVHALTRARDLVVASWIRVLTRARANLLDHTALAHSRIYLVVVSCILKKYQAPDEDEARFDAALTLFFGEMLS
jgi:hypothetical protein